MQLTQQGAQKVEEIARRYYVSVDAVMTLLEAVNNGGGTMAQFSHPELGGGGQWMQGGMTMVGDMFNNNLKSKVDNLCNELAGALASQTMIAPPPANQAQNGGGYGAASFSVSGGGNQWWPADLGSPSSSGSQNNIRYAVFPSTRRLAIDSNGQVTVYDTLDHQIGGVSQQQGYDASVTFSSQYGMVSIANLPIVQGVGSAPGQSQPEPFNAAVQPPSSAEQGDIFAQIERLAELRQKGILSDVEFANKKAELLGRL